MKETPDFNRVEDHQLPIHERLCNWARWCSTRPHKAVHPMFRLYKPAQPWEAPDYRPTCDLIDAQALEKVVRTLPTTHMFLTRWVYVYRFPAAIARRESGLSYEGMEKHIRDARQMVMKLLP